MHIYLNRSHVLVNHMYRRLFFSKIFCLRYQNPSSKFSSRNFSYSSVLKEENKQDTSNKEKLKIKPFKENEDHIWVGPPHPVSNLRLKVFPTSKHLTKEETHFYEKSKEIQEWSQQYWESHNKDFEDSKKTYIEKVSKERKSDVDVTHLTSEEMADFYKEFLNKNYNKHVSFNWQWYKRNFELLYLSAKAKVSKIGKNGKR